MDERHILNLQNKYSQLIPNRYTRPNYNGNIKKKTFVAHPYNYEKKFNVRKQRPFHSSINKVGKNVYHCNKYNHEYSNRIQSNVDVYQKNFSKKNHSVDYSDDSDQEISDSNVKFNCKLGLESAEEIQAWREERKKNFPTKNKLEALLKYSELYPEIEELNSSLKLKRHHSRKKENNSDLSNSTIYNRNKSTNKTKNSTILESVLMDQIIEERVWILQAIRFIVNNNFFDGN